LAWRVEFTSSALKEFSKIDHVWQKRITAYLREASDLPNPRMRGKALTGNFGGLWRYRIGDYRVVCQLHDDLLVVQVVRVAHRSGVYD